MSRLLLVSNRLPINMIKRGKEVRFQPSAGGVATGLGSIFQSYRSVWIGWPGIACERIKGKKKAIEKQLMSQNFHPVFLSQQDIERYYHGFSNKTLWPLFHYFNQYAIYSKSSWSAYIRTNKLFRDVVLKLIKPDDMIWIHDYHLMLLPKLIREKRKDVTIGFFLHIPFPSFEVFSQLPWYRDIMKGLLASDLIGFHTYDYVRHFIESVRRLMGYEHYLGRISAGNRVVGVDAFPMGINYKRFAGATNDPEVRKEIGKIRKKIQDRRIILSIDRLDYTKGIPQRLEAFDIFLDKNPEYKGKVSLILVAVPSRTKVEHYTALKRQVDELVGRVNGKHSMIGYTPVWYLYQFQTFPKLTALYNIADIGLITPIKDGMNLIAKEFIAAKSNGKGTLILSEMAGAASELGEALNVNPNSVEEMAEAIKEALLMSEEEQMERNKIMQRRLQQYNVIRWAVDFMDRLTQMKKLKEELGARSLTPVLKHGLKNDFGKSDQRLILLDYDGTLVPFAKKPEQAEPDEEILTLIENLSHGDKNELVVVSGRDRETLQRWFGSFRIGLIAEHGVWLKERDMEWKMVEPLSNEWKKEIRPILELHVDRTPGSFIEEKEYSLVWHCRKSDPALADIRTRELKDALLNLTEHLNLGVLEGSKVIEIKNAGINKGRAALNWISKNWDFILAIGDDWTDEDLFAELPVSAYSIKVGIGPSHARFNLDSVTQVRLLLKELVE